MPSGQIETCRPIYSFSEAAEMWGLGESTLRNRALTGGFERMDLKYGSDFIKSGSTWLITDMSMRKIYGPPKHKRIIKKPAKKAKV
jgi:hypothetical protein